MTSRLEKQTRKLTLEISGPEITADKFRRGVNAFLDIVNEVVKDISGSKKNIKWIVSVRSGSVALDFEPRSVSKLLPDQRIDYVVDTIQTGCRSLEKKPSIPPHFNETALARTRELASITNGKRKGLDSVKIIRNGQTDRITSKTVAHIDSLFETASEAWGSVDGRLSVVSERGGLNILVYDRVLDKYIRCIVPENKLPSALAAYRKRVYVSGLIRYHRNGDIKEIELEELEVFPDSRSLPDFEDLFGMFAEAE